MRESFKSLKIYFGIVGVFGVFQLGSFYLLLIALLYGTSFSMFRTVSLAILTLAQAALGITFFYIAIKLDELLVRRPRFIINTLVLMAAIGLISNLVYGSLGANIIGIIATVLLPVYLIRNIKRISKEKIGSPESVA